MKLPLDDAVPYKQALEPLTRTMTECEGSEAEIASIAISLKRIAVALEKIAEDLDT